MSYLKINNSVSTYLFICLLSMHSLILSFFWNRVWIWYIVSFWFSWFLWSINHVVKAKSSDKIVSHNCAEPWFSICLLHKKKKNSNCHIYFTVKNQIKQHHHWIWIEADIIKSFLQKNNKLLISINIIKKFKKRKNKLRKLY